MTLSRFQDGRAPLPPLRPEVAAGTSEFIFIFAFFYARPRSFVFYTTSKKKYEKAPSSPLGVWFLSLQLFNEIRNEVMSLTG